MKPFFYAHGHSKEFYALFIPLKIILNFFVKNKERKMRYLQYYKRLLKCKLSEAVQNRKDTLVDKGGRYAFI
ncbi:MAG TPA: hypothetical protein DEB74_04220 [Lachnospiraceae bacterium]|nr:hypothetical protein [Lachnospiraceae bacterium]